MSAAEQAVQQDIAPPFIDGMPNEEYHRPERGLSCSRLKDFIRDPALIKWGETAEQDRSAMGAIDFGTDFHAYFLEPERFKFSHRVLPEFNRRVKAEKEAEIALIDEWREGGIVAVKAEDMAKLEAMRRSAESHPTVEAIMQMSGHAERSYFWTDEKTGIRCKCRPDWIVTSTSQTMPRFVPDDCKVLVADVKTIADITRIQAQIENLRYYLQDAFYTEGIQIVEGGRVCFAFIFVSTSLSLGRYPVQVVVLDETAKFDGRQEMREALDDYAAMSRSADESVWETAITLDRPSWATREESIF